MSNEIVRVFVGHTFATPDGEEFTVADLDPRSGYVVIENLQDDRGVMHLSDMLEAIKSGALVNIDEDEEDDAATDLEEAESD
jgi:hypothetical protein